jgi:hypothetical protein
MYISFVKEKKLQPNLFNEFFNQFYNSLLYNYGWQIKETTVENSIPQMKGQDTPAVLVGSIRLFNTNVSPLRPEKPNPSISFLLSIPLLAISYL